MAVDSVFVFAIDSLCNGFLHRSGLNASNHKLLQQQTMIHQLYPNEAFYTV